MRSICVITVDPQDLPIFFQVLQNGLVIQADVGCDLEQFLCTLFSLPIETIEQRAQILFLDGKAVDDMKSAVVSDGSSLALSSAMPGLAGTALRRGGHLARLRSGITHRGEEATTSPGRGSVTIRFFNLLIAELGLPLLSEGVCVRGVDLAHVLRDLAKALSVSSAKIRIDSTRIAAARLPDAETISGLEKKPIWLFRVERNATIPTHLGQ